MTRIFFALAIIGAVCLEARSQTKQDKQLVKVLDALFTNQFKPTEPGAVVFIAKGGQVIYQKGFGSADLELGVPLRPEMIFRLGSITKQFTAMAILQLEEQSKLSLKDSIQKFIPDFPWRGKITIENLLTHTSGITEYTQLNIADPFIRRRDLTPKEIVDLFKNEPLEFKPGTKFKYSNSGYFLLGYIIENVSGMSYPAYIKKNIIDRIGLANTFYDDMDKIITNRAKGYRNENNSFLNAEYQSPTIPYAAGSLISNTSDLYQWTQALNKHLLLKKENLDKAFSPFKLADGTVTSYGFGWFLLDMAGSPSIQHGGNINGFKSNEIYFPKEDVFIAVLSNCECFPMEQVSEQIAWLSLGKVPPAKPAVEIPESVMNEYQGKYRFESDPKRAMIISREDERLYASVPGEWKAQLVAISQTKFDIKDIRPTGTIDFIADATGRVQKLVVTQSGKEYVGIKE